MATVKTKKRAGYAESSVILPSGPALVTSGGKKTYVIEIGPIEQFGFTEAQTKRAEVALRRSLDAVVREIVSVGPYSKIVRTTVSGGR